MHILRLKTLEIRYSQFFVHHFTSFIKCFSFCKTDFLFPLSPIVNSSFFSILFENIKYHEMKGLKYFQWKCKWSKWSEDALDAYNFCCPIYFCLRKYTYEVQGYDIGLFINLEPKNVRLGLLHNKTSRLSFLLSRIWGMINNINLLLKSSRLRLKQYLV